ncbi:MAG: saccharopine dehydrogenase NADP-binding domain-containing protein, partial [Stellaceae bacterium]
MKPPLKIAIAGLGTVGTGVAQLLARNGDLIARRAGRRIELRAVLERDRKRDRKVDLSKPKWHGGLRDLTADAGVDAVVELIGGTEGVALGLVKAALAAGKHVVTANKAMMAHHGNELADLAAKNGVALAFEAAVAGGIPILKALR